jgi:hypothetical protein
MVFVNYQIGLLAVQLRHIDIYAASGRNYSETEALSALTLYALRVLHGK